MRRALTLCPSHGSSQQPQAIPRSPRKCHRAAKDSQHSGVTVLPTMRILALTVAAFLLAPGAFAPAEDVEMIALEGGRAGADLPARASPPERATSTSGPTPRT
jgi:hypothetical protein